MKSESIREKDVLPGSAYLSLILALASILVLCIPFLGYVSIALSSAGLLLAGHETWRSLGRGHGSLGYGLAASAACLVSMFLALLPWLFH
jgi:hypothetical protein